MIKKRISELKSSLEDSKNIGNIQNQPNITNLKKHHIVQLSNQSMDSSMSQKPLQPILFHKKSIEDKGQPQLDKNIKKHIKTHAQIQLDNHRIRKQAESQHNKTIHEFYKRKKFLARIINKQDNLKIKTHQIINKRKECQTIFQKRSIHNFLQKDTSNSIFGQNNNCSGQMLNSKIANRQKILAQLTNSYVSSAINLKKVNLVNQNQLRNPFIKINNTLSRRQVYLSNISNLEELRHSISHSRAKFHKKYIKMEREIGRNYIPFDDQVLGDKNDVKGIFL